MKKNSLKSDGDSLKSIDEFNNFMVHRGAFSKSDSGQVIMNPIDSMEMNRHMDAWRLILKNDKKKQCQ